MSPSAFTVYRWELRKLRFQKRTYLGLGAAVLVPILFVVATHFRHRGPEDVPFGSYITRSGLAIPLVILLFGAIWMFPLITALVASGVVSKSRPPLIAGPAGTLILIGRWVSSLMVRHPRLQERLIGAPTVIINNGQLIRDQMRREHLTEEQVMTVLRQHGVAHPRDVKMAVLEVDGTLSVVPRHRD